MTPCIAGGILPTLRRRSPLSNGDAKDPQVGPLEAAVGERLEDAAGLLATDEIDRLLAGRGGRARPKPNSRLCPKCRANTIERICPHDGFNTVLAKDYEDESITDDQMVGTVFAERYLIKGLLGAGGYGSVYRAEQIGVGRDVALKVLKSERTRKLKDIARFQQEGRAIAALKHPNIITLHDFGQSDDGNLFLAMELAEGESLGRLIKRCGSQPADRVVDFGVQIFDALAEAHEASIIHRDLKPDNILIAVEGRRSDVVKVLDFGIAKVSKDMAVVPESLTSTGMTIGSPRYMSPEQCQAEPATPQSDIYAVGCILYEALCGQPMFRCKNVTNYMLSHISVKPSLPRLEDIQLSGPLVDVIMSCLAKDPAMRPANAEAAMEALQACRGLAVQRRDLAPMNQTVTIPPNAQLTAAAVQAASELAGRDLDTGLNSSASVSELGPAPTTATTAAAASNSPGGMWLLGLAALLMAAVGAYFAWPPTDVLESGSVKSRSKQATGDISRLSKHRPKAGATREGVAASGLADHTVVAAEPRETSEPSKAMVAAAKAVDTSAKAAPSAVVPRAVATPASTTTVTAGAGPVSPNVKVVAPLVRRVVLESVPSGVEVRQLVASGSSVVTRVLGRTPLNVIWTDGSAVPRLVLKQPGYFDQPVGLRAADAGSHLKIALRAKPVPAVTTPPSPPSTKPHPKKGKKLKKSKKAKKSMKKVQPKTEGAPPNFGTVDD